MPAGRAFTGVQANNYWSSTTNSTNTTNAWNVNLNNGNTNDNNKTNNNLEENLMALHEELTSGAYRPGSSMAFLVQKPKRREIFAADFRNRVVHHVLVGHLEPCWERRFIHDSYACRKERGTPTRG